MLIPRPVFGQNPGAFADRPALNRVLGERWVQLAFCVILAFAVRIATFGDPALHTDEELYFLIGQKMLDGQLPYVDLWDRKPLGLFLLNAGFASISRSVLSYQIAASLSVALTGFVLMAILRDMVRWPARFAVAFFYITLLPTLGGFGGQSPVFYNLLVALAMLLLVRSLPELGEGRVPLRIHGAIVLGGLALTIKQTTAVEFAFIGLFAIYTATRAGMPRLTATGHLVGFALLGMLPLAAFGLFYASTGHLAEYYHAMVVANVTKAPLPARELLINFSGMLSAFWLPLLLAVCSIATAPKSQPRSLFGLWLLASAVGFCLIPNFYWHYALSMVGPACCCIALLLDRTKVKLLLPVVLATGSMSLIRAESFNFAIHRQSAENFAAMASAIDAHAPRGTLLVYDGPVYLYAATQTRPLSPLVFPGHLKEKTEDGTSGRSIVAETARILRERPGAVTFAYHDKQRNQIKAGRAMVRKYVETHCRPITRQWIFETLQPLEITVFGDCR